VRNPIPHGFERLFDVLRQLGEPACERSGARDEYDIDPAGFFRRSSVRLAQTPARPVSRHCPSDPTGHREPDPTRTRVAWPPERNEIAPVDTPTPFSEHELKVGGA